MEGKSTGYLICIFYLSVIYIRQPQLYWKLENNHCRSAEIRHRRHSAQQKFWEQWRNVSYRRRWWVNPLPERYQMMNRNSVCSEKANSCNCLSFNNVSLTWNTSEQLGSPTKTENQRPLPSIYTTWTFQVSRVAMLIAHCYVIVANNLFIMTSSKTESFMVHVIVMFTQMI